MCGLTTLATCAAVVVIGKGIQANTPIAQVPTPVESNVNQTVAQNELSDAEYFASKNCDTLTLMANNGMNRDGENYVMTVSQGDLEQLAAAKRICPQHF